MRPLVNLSALMASCLACSNDTTQLTEPEVVAGPLSALDVAVPAPPSDEAGPGAAVAMPEPARAPDSGAATVSDAGVACEPPEELQLRVHWLQSYFSPGCSYFAASLAGSGALTQTAESGAQTARLRQRGDALELQLGDAPFQTGTDALPSSPVSQTLTFERVLDCPATPLRVFSPWLWRVTEELWGAWLGPGPLQTCTEPAPRFVGTYHYEECELQFDRSCLQGQEWGNCTVSAKFELEVLPAGPPTSDVPSSALAGECLVAPSECRGKACAPVGGPCTRNEDCAVGLFCNTPSCVKPGACAPLPTPDDCPPELDAPTCDCNGIAHDSVCFANAQALSATPGECPFEVD